MARPIRQIPPEEALVHGFVLWLLADLFDSLTERPGVIDQKMRETAAGRHRDQL
jgi:hypothetical protein